MKNLYRLFFVCLLLLLPFSFAHADESKTESGEETVIEAPKVRFLPIFSDDEYNYYLDTTTIKLVPHPYRKEKIVDVWIKLEHNANAIYSDSAINILQHYYMRQVEAEQQLLSEIIVNSDENSASEQRAKYSEENWQALIPESSEESCYMEIMNYVKKYIPEEKPKKKKILGLF